MAIRWRDWVAALSGAWLMVSPDALGYTLERSAASNAYGVGLVVLLFNVISACRLIDQGQEIFNILLGAWLVLSPYSLGFRDDRLVAANATAVGALIAIFAFWSMAGPSKQEKS